MPTTVTIHSQTILIPESGDPCELWVSYYTTLKKHAGSAHARMLWLVTWKANGNIRCTTNPQFNQWLQKNNLDVSNAATRTIADLSQMGSNIAGLGKNLTTVVAWGIPITLVIVLIGIGVLVINTTQKADLSDAAMLLPQGRAITTLKTLTK